MERLSGDAIRVTVREWHPGQAMRSDDATRTTRLVEEVELVVAALTAQGVPAEKIQSIFNRPDIKAMMPGQKEIGEQR